MYIVKQATGHDYHALYIIGEPRAKQSSVLIFLCFFCFPFEFILSVVIYLTGPLLCLIFWINLSFVHIFIY